MQEVNVFQYLGSILYEHENLWREKKKSCKMVGRISTETKKALHNSSLVLTLTCNSVMHSQN